MLHTQLQGLSGLGGEGGTEQARKIEVSEVGPSLMKRHKKEYVNVLSHLQVTEVPLLGNRPGSALRPQEALTPK